MPDQKLISVQCDYVIEVGCPGQRYVFSWARCKNRVRIHPEYRGVVYCHIHRLSEDREKQLRPGGNAVLVR